MVLGTYTPSLKDSWLKHGPKEAWYCCGVHNCPELIHAWDIAKKGLWMQHGKSPEHRRFLHWNESGYAWLLEVHRHERS